MLLLLPELNHAHNGYPGHARHGPPGSARCATPTAATGGGSFAPSSRWRRTRGSSGWARWAAAAKARSAAFEGLKPYLLGRDPARIEELRFLVANPTASLYNNRTQMLAAIEFACLDLLGQKWGVPVSEILGGRLAGAGAVRLLPLLPLPASRGRQGEVRTIEQLVAEARRAQGAVRVHDAQAEGRRLPAGIRAGVLPRRRRRSSEDDSFRFDPNGVWSAEQAIWFGQQIEGIRNDYFEDPVFGLERDAPRAREGAMPLATNTVVVNFEQLQRQRAVTRRST